LFPLGGRFEMWSLPKIIGCASGGVVWCRSAEDAQALRRSRDARRGGAGMQFTLRVLGKRFPALLDYWAGRESLCGYLPDVAAADVLEALSDWRNIARERETRFAMFEPCLPRWLPRPKARLPCVVPVAAEPGLEAALRDIGIRIGLRHFERIHADGAVELVPVLPIPIHQGAPLPLLEQAAALLNRHSASGATSETSRPCPAS
jgi:putative PLP-dependent aminotransferase (TIGR04422 family)